MLIPVDVVDNMRRDWVSTFKNLQEPNGLKHQPKNLNA